MGSVDRIIAALRARQMAGCVGEQAGFTFARRWMVQRTLCATATDELVGVGPLRRQMDQKDGLRRKQRERKRERELRSQRMEIKWDQIESYVIGIEVDALEIAGNRSWSR